MKLFKKIDPLTIMFYVSSTAVIVGLLNTGFFAWYLLDEQKNVPELCPKCQKEVQKTADKAPKTLYKSAQIIDKQAFK